MNLHVVSGTGQAGNPLVELLLAPAPTPQPPDHSASDPPKETTVSTQTASPTLQTTFDRATARKAGAALALASALGMAGFTVLGSVFRYPDILGEPTADILQLYRAHQGTVAIWFGVLVLAAALLAPAGLWLGRLAGGTLGRWIAGIGIAAAVVQVLGLQRWVTIVPGLADDAPDPTRQADAENRFELIHTVLGTAIGETLGYALTATFTVLFAVGLRRSVLPGWLAITGYVAAGLIATGVVIPVLEAADLTNFVGYVLWCVWVLVVAGYLAWGRPTRGRDR